jgi:hypothetical protein
MADEFDGGFGFDDQPVEEQSNFGLDDVDAGYPVDGQVDETPEEPAYNDGTDDFGMPAEDDLPSPSAEDVFGLDDGSSNLHADAFVAQVETGGSAYAKWEKEHEKALIAKAEKQRAEKQQIAADAKKELEDFHAKREAKIKKNMGINRSEEKQMKAELAQTNATGSEWEKVAKYCDLKPKQEGKGGQTAKNERMRKLIVSLKNEGLTKAK